MIRSLWLVVEAAREEPGLNPVSHEASEEDANVGGDEHNVAHQFSLVVAQLHVASQISFRVGHEQEVCEASTALTTDPDRPQEDDGKALNWESKNSVDGEQDEVYGLECSWDPWVFKRHLLKTGQREEISEVIGKLEHGVLMKENVRSRHVTRNTASVQ